MQKILIIRFSSIGDIVLSSPVIRCIHKQLPGAEIHFLTKEKYHDVVRANPYIARTHLLRDNLGSLIRSLRETGFDYIVDLHRNIRSFRVKQALGVRSGTFDKLNLEKWLLVNFKVNRLPEMHIVDRYFRAVKSLGVENDGKGLDYFIPEGDMLHASELPDGFDEGFVALVIGGMHQTKMLPEEKLMELAGLISKPVILLGGPDDHVRGERIAAGSNGSVFNACGAFNINQSASIIKMAGSVITHDTGLMHIAAAFRKEIWSVWGNTIPGFGMYPYLPAGEGRSVLMQVEGLRCRPCSKIGYARCPKKHFRCMNDIPVEGLARMVSE